MQDSNIINVLANLESLIDQCEQSTDPMVKHAGNALDQAFNRIAQQAAPQAAQPQAPNPQQQQEAHNLGAALIPMLVAIDQQRVNVIAHQNQFSRAKNAIDALNNISATVRKYITELGVPSPVAAQPAPQQTSPAGIRNTIGQAYQIVKSAQRPASTPKFSRDFIMMQQSVARDMQTAITALGGYWEG